MTLQFYLIQNN